MLVSQRVGRPGTGKRAPGPEALAGLGRTPGLAAGFRWFRREASPQNWKRSRRPPGPDRVLSPSPASQGRLVAAGQGGEWGFHGQEDAGFGGVRRGGGMCVHKREAKEPQPPLRNPSPRGRAPAGWPPQITQRGPGTRVSHLAAPPAAGCLVAPCWVTA